MRAIWTHATGRPERLGPTDKKFNVRFADANPSLWVRRRDGRLP
jgi:hypothetical protein